VYRRLPLSDPPTATQELVHDDNALAILALGLVAGSALTAIYLFYALVVRTKKADYDFSNPSILNQLAQSSDEKGTAVVKRAGTRKVNKMLLNARRMHRASATSTAAPTTIGTTYNHVGKSLTASKKIDLVKLPTDQVFQTYVMDGETHVPCGSWPWVFRRLVSRELFEVEGIWLPSRLWIFQIMQCAVFALLFILGRLLIQYAIESANDATDQLQEGLPGWVYDLVPTAREVEIALLPSFWIAAIVCVSIILLYVPR
jgi:hypothetical protein